MCTIPKMDFQDHYYYSAPKKKPQLNSLDEADPEPIKTFEKLGISLEEQKRLVGVAVDVVFDSVSVKTTFRETLKEKGIIFCSFSDAVQEHPDLVKKYLGSVVPRTDNFYAALNSAVFSDGSFCYIPPGVRCPMELSTSLPHQRGHDRPVRAHAADRRRGRLRELPRRLHGTHPRRAPAARRRGGTGRAEGRRDQVQHRPELVPGDKEGKGGIYNFVTKRGLCLAERSKIGWTQVETGSAITWKYPSCMLKGDDSIGEFYSVAVTNNRQQADTGTKMVHIGKGTKSTIVSKGHQCRPQQQQLPRPGEDRPWRKGRAQLQPVRFAAARRPLRRAHLPLHRGENLSAMVEHEATTSKDRRDRIFYLNSRGIETEKAAVSIRSNGYAKEVLNQLPMEFAVEAQKLLAVSLEDRRINIRSVDPAGRPPPPSAFEELGHTMLKINENLHANIDGKEILKGLDLEVKPGSARHHGPQRLRQKHPGQRTGRPGGIRSDGRLRDLPRRGPAGTGAPEERAWKGIFLAFQYPVEIPGVSNLNFLRTALNETARPTDWMNWVAGLPSPWCVRRPSWWRWTLT